jgi:uncharacterized protein (TIGR02271 family)
MSQLRSFPLILDNGERAELLSTARFLDGNKDRVVRLRDGREFLVPRTAVETAPDGTFRLRMKQDEIERMPGSGRKPARRQAAAEETVVPALEEEIHVGKRRVETGRLRVRKQVETRNAAVEETLLSREYDVEHVPVDRLIPEPVEPRYEGDTLILPVFEEVLVLEKRLVLREEIRITRRTRERVDRQTVPVRREHVDVERVK